MEHLPVFLRLLARSATGQAITAYTSHFHGPRPGGELHIVLVDNGRSRLLADPEHGRSLTCIRCAACLNTCPVFRRSGGHSYGVTAAGPIGSILAPAPRAPAPPDLFLRLQPLRPVQGRLPGPHRPPPPAPRLAGRARTARAAAALEADVREGADRAAVPSPGLRGRGPPPPHRGPGVATRLARAARPPL